MSIVDDPEDCLECGRPGLPVAEAWQLAQLAGLPSLDALRCVVTPANGCWLPRT